MMEETPGLQKLLVGTLFDDFPILDDDYLIRIADRGQAVSDDKTGPSFHQAQEGFLDARFRARVYTGRCFIEDENTRVRKNRAGDREQLALSLAQVTGAFGKSGLISERQLMNEVIRIRKFCRLDTFLIRRVESAIADVFLDRIGKQE